MALSLLLWGLGSGLYLYLWPIYVASLGASSQEIGLLIAFGGASAIAGYLVGGVLAARFDWRLILLAGWAMGAISALDYAFARTWWMLIPGVFLLDFSGFSSPAMNSYIATASRTSEERNRAFLIVFAAYSLGIALAAPIGGWIGDHLGIRPLFLIAFLLYVASTIALIPLRPRYSAARTVERPIHWSQLYLQAPRLPRFRSLLLLLSGLFLTAYLGSPLAPLFLQEQARLSTGLVEGLGSLSALGGVALAVLFAQLSRRWRLNHVLAIAHLLVLGCFATFLLTPELARVSPAMLVGATALGYLLQGAIVAEYGLAQSGVSLVIPLTWQKPATRSS